MAEVERPPKSPALESDLAGASSESGRVKLSKHSSALPLRSKTTVVGGLGRGRYRRLFGCWQHSNPAAATRAGEPAGIGAGELVRGIERGDPRPMLGWNANIPFCKDSAYEAAAAVPDLSRLLGNAVRWMMRDSTPVTVSGEGRAEVVAFKTQAGRAVHILNSSEYTNPEFQRGWLTRAYAIGPQRVRFREPAGVKAAKVRLLRADQEVAFTRCARRRWNRRRWRA